LLVFIGTTLDLAQKRAEDIRGKADVLSSQLEGNALQVTLSFGVASLPVHGKNWEEVVSKADKALYQSKRDGRNRVTVWPVDVVT
jgi:diguanylate cyclase (GGDEF)-like protein